MGVNRSRQDPGPLEVTSVPDDEMADDEMADDEMVDEMADDEMADDEMPDDEMPDDEVPDRGYELDLDKHSPTDLDAVIQDAVKAVERAEHAGEPDESGDGEPLGGEPADADQLRSELADLQERLLRTMADFDNFRKRTEREKETLRLVGASDVLRDFLTVGDNLDRALDSPGGIEDLKQGLRMILRQLEERLRRHGVERIESVGRPFDPTLHEAVATEQSSEVEMPTVTQEAQKGYLFHDRLLRPAMVWVAMPAAEPAQRETGEAASSVLVDVEEVEGIDGDGKPDPKDTARRAS